MLLETTLSSSDLSWNGLPRNSLVSLEYTDDTVLFSEDDEKTKCFLTTLTNDAGMFGIRLSPSKCKMLLQDWLMSPPELVIRSEVVKRIDCFTYFGSLITTDSLVSDKISAQIKKARLAFGNFVTSGVKRYPSSNQRSSLHSSSLSSTLYM